MNNRRIKIICAVGIAVCIILIAMAVVFLKRYDGSAGNTSSSATKYPIFNLICSSCPRLAVFIPVYSNTVSLSLQYWMLCGCRRFIWP